MGIVDKDGRGYLAGSPLKLSYWSKIASRDIKGIPDDDTGSRSQLAVGF